MGDPLEITVRGYTLSLRRADAENIVLVEKDNEESFLDSLKKRRDKLIKSAKAELETFAKLDISDKATRKEAVKLTEFLTDDCDINSDCPKCSKNFISKSIKHDDQTAEKDPIHIALAGNPNCGKTTLFNALTGAREYVGNWPGVTVEKKEGRISAKRCESEDATARMDIQWCWLICPAYIRFPALNGRNHSKEIYYRGISCRNNKHR